MATRNAVSEWGELAESQGWTLRKMNHSMQWLPPGGGPIITTPLDSHTAPTVAMANAKRALTRAGLQIPATSPKGKLRVVADEEAPEAPDAIEEEEEPGLPLTADDVARALDSVANLVSEEVASLRAAHEELASSVVALREEMARFATTLALVRDLGAKLEADIHAAPPVEYVTQGDLRRATLALQEALEAAVARVDPLANMRAKMRGA